MMRKEPKANSRYKKIPEDRYVIELLKVICTIMYNYNYHKYQPEAIHEAICHLCNMQQSPNMDIQTYFDRLKSQVGVIGTVGGHIADYMALVTSALGEILGSSVDIVTPTSDEEKKVNQTSKYRYMGCLFVVNSDMKRYIRLNTDLEKNSAKGNKEWPQSMQESYALMIIWKHANTGCLPALL